MAYGYIYLLRNKINGKIYIGKKKGHRVKESYYGSGTAISNAVEKYGKESFDREILDWADSLEALNEREKYWIEEYNAQSKEIGYNLTAGGDGFAGHHSESARARIGAAHRGRPHSEEHRKKLSEAARKRSPMSEETRRKISEGHKGIPCCFKGKKRSEEDRRKMSEAAKRRAKPTAVTRAKHANRMKGNSYGKGRIHITNGVDHKMIYPNDFEKFEKLGWRRGWPAKRGA